MEPRLDGSESEGWASGLISIGDILDHAAAALIDHQSNLALQGREHVGFRDGADDLPFAEDDALAIPGGKSNIGVTRFAGSIDNTPHHRDSDRLGHRGEELIDLIGQGEEIDFDASARGAGNHDRALLTQLEALENLVGNEHFLDWISRQ